MKKFIATLVAVLLIFSAVTVSFAATGDLAYEPPFEFYSIAGYTYHAYTLGVVRCKSTYLYGSSLCQVSYSLLVDFCSQLNSAQSYYQFVVTNVKSNSSENRYMVTARHNTSSGNGFGSTYEGRLGGYYAGDTVIYYASVSSGSTPDSGSGSGSSGGSTSSPTDTDYTSLLEWIGNSISVLNDNLNGFWSDISRKLDILDDWFLLQYNQVSDMFRVISANQLAEYDLLLTFLSSFDRRFSDLDLTYYNEAEITLYNGDYLDWSESDRGAINIEATDIGTLELIGFPDLSGYVVDHSYGDDIIVRRNDGTYFPDTWVLDGGTVTMPVITDGYASISVTAPAGAVVTVAGNTHTMTADSYSVNVDFGTYDIDVSYTDGDEVLTTSYTVEVDGYNDYAVNFAYTPGGFVVTVSSQKTGSSASGLCKITLDGNTYSADDFYNNPREFRLSVGSVITFSASSVSCTVYVDGAKYTGNTYTVTSDCSISFTTALMSGRWDITTSDTSSIVGSFDTPTVTINANPATITPLTIQMLVLPSGSSFWYAIDTDGNQYSFDPVSNLALNRSFVVHTYTAEEVANLDNFPSGYWMVSWSGSSKYITVKFEEYSKFFLWLNRFLINFRDTLYTKMEDITVTADGDVIISSTDYTEQLNTIIGKLDGVVTDIDSVTNVNISLDNDAYNVFYVTGEDGETQSVTEFAGDLTTASGRLLSLLYRLVFSDALSMVDDDLNGFEDFFTSQEQTESASYAYGQDTSSEDVDVWLAS